jgi:hypothetical protein
MAIETIATTPLEYALKYASIGLCVFPLIPGTKIPATVNGVKDATKDEKQIRTWWEEENSDYGIGLAPEFKVGGACFLEFDQRPWLPAWAKEENQKKPLTRLHKSGGKDSPHYIFSHTEKSLELGNVNGMYAGLEWFSFRADRRYVVAPPSVHPDSKREYTVELDMEPTPIPDWLVAKIAKSGVSEQKFSEGLRQTSEEFDDEAFFEWLEECGCNLGVEDGSWIPFLTCPVAGHRHEGQGARGCALFWDGGGLGFKCHAQGCPSNTDRKHNQSGIGFLVSFLSKEHQPYEGTIWNEQPAEELVAEFGAVAETAQEVKEWNEKSSAETVAKLKAKVADRKVEEEAPEPEPESRLKYPALAFPYDALPPGRFKELTDKACEGGLSAGLVVPALMALVSSLPLQDRVEGARINFYVTLLAMVGAGKDTAIDRAGSMLGLRNNEVGWTSRAVTVYTPSGERSISTLIGDQPGTKENPARTPGPRTHCMVTYELEETLRKNKGETSGVFPALQHFYDHNGKEYSDSKYRHKQIVNCRLSWLTALPVGDSEIDELVYRKAFGDSSSHGFVSRMIFGFAEERFDRRKTRNWEAPTTLMGQVEEKELDFGVVTVDFRSTLESQFQDAKCDGFAPGVEELYLNWQPEKDWSGRDTYHVLKVAALCAILQGHKRIEETDWKFAVAFMGWQGRIRQAFTPGRAKSTTQAEFNDIVIREVQKRTKNGLSKESGKDKNIDVVTDENGKRRVYIRWKGMSNAGRWHEHGVDVEKTIRTLVSGGALEYKYDPIFDEQGAHIKDEADNVWVRIVGWKPE